MPWSIEQLFRRNIKTKLSQNVANEIHDKKEEPYMQSLRILASEKIPEKFGDYHVILRYANFISCPETILYALSK
jgi:hypothetical protein